MLIVVAAAACAAQNPAEYTVNIHVVSSRLDTGLYGKPPSSTITQELDVLIDGKKYELAGTPILVSLLHFGLIVPGDYKAKLVLNKHKGAYAYAAEYELLFPDQTTKKFTVIGQTE